MPQDHLNHLYLIRHGENVANLTLEFSHRRIDHSLTPKGVEQARQTAEFLREQALHEVYASPLKRAAETAALIAGPQALPVQIVESFREINVGDFEDQPPTAELWAHHNAIIREWASGNYTVCFPGGEDCHSLVARGIAGLRQIMAGKAGRRIVVVAHGGILIFTLRHLFKDPHYDQYWAQGMANCAVTELEAGVVDGRITARLLSYNTTSHLSGAAADQVSGILPDPDHIR